jgi:hypothetical protein
MPEKLRLEIDDGFVVERDCAICTAPALRVHHLPKFADYVSCDECDSSFVLEEDGDRVLYGKIAEEYTDTAKVVLHNWMSLTVVDRLATSERMRKGLSVPEIPEMMAPEDIEARLGGPPEHVEETTAQRPVKDADVIDVLELPEAMALVDSGARLDEGPEPPLEAPSEAPAKGQRKSLHAFDDESDTSSEDVIDEATLAAPRTVYRVRIEGESVYFPVKGCVHCMSTPADHKLSVPGSLPVGFPSHRRRRAVFSVPVCADCRRQYNARSEAQKNARLQAHLSSLIVGLALVVVAIGLDFINMDRNAAVGLLLVGIIAGIGYLLPVGFLLERTKRIPPLRESYLVRSTLSIRAPDEPAAETLFDFRNQDYANLFWESNPKVALGNVREITIQPKKAANED